MKFFNSIAAALIFSAALYLSFSHTWDLYRSYGYNINHQDLVGAIMVEVAFFTSFINSIVGKSRGGTKGKGAQTMLWLSALVVAGSNIRFGWGHGYMGIALGVLTPVFMVLMEMIVSKEIIDGIKAKEEAQEKAEKQEAAAQKRIDRDNKPKPPKGVSSQKLVAISKWVEEHKLHAGDFPSRSALMKKFSLSDGIAKRILDDLSIGAEGEADAMQTA